MRTRWFALIVIYYHWRAALVLYFGNIRACLWMLRRALRGDVFTTDFVIDKHNGREYALNILTHVKEYK